jgi:ribonuclease P protein component
MKHTFKKDERLRNRQIIDRLFKRGSTEVHTFYLFPFRVLYLRTPPPASDVNSDPRPSPPLPQVLFSVSKRNFKKATDRNLIRRRCREAYRLHKHLLARNSPLCPPESIAFLYLAKEKATYDVIEKAMIKIITKMAASA